MQIRKPYVPIDTCSPAGDWIEEKRYNRQRPTSNTHARKVLCGNWQEEQILENDMLKVEAAELANSIHGKQNATVEGQAAAAVAASTSSSSPLLNSMRSGCNDFSRTSYLKASLDVIKDKGNGLYAGGFNSTPYLISHENADEIITVNNDNTDKDNNEMRTSLHAHKSTASIDAKMKNTTTQRADYNKDSSNVKALERPALGVRSQVLLKQFLKAAEETIEREDVEKAAQMTALAASHVLPSHSVGGFGKLDALGNPYNSIYKVTMCNSNEKLPVIDELNNDYLGDVPITVYTGNPHTQTVMQGITGKTKSNEENFMESSPSATSVLEEQMSFLSAKSQFGRYTYFTDPKYNLEKAGMHK